MTDIREHRPWDEEYPPYAPDRMQRRIQTLEQRRKDLHACLRLALLLASCSFTQRRKIRHLAWDNHNPLR